MVTIGIAEMMGIDRTSVTKILDSVQIDRTGDIHKDFTPPLYNGH